MTVGFGALTSGYRTYHDEDSLGEACSSAASPGQAPADRIGGVHAVSWQRLWGSLSSRLPGGSMTDVGTRNGQRRSSARAIEIRVGARLENLAVLRAVVTAVGAFEDLNLDSVADLRLAVDEACTRLIRSAALDSTLVMLVDPRDDDIVVEASTTCATADVLSPGSFSWHVLTSLTDDVQTFHDGHEVGGEVGRVGISMTTRRASSAR